MFFFFKFIASSSHLCNLDKTMIRREMQKRRKFLCRSCKIECKFFVTSLRNPVREELEKKFSLRTTSPAGWALHSKNRNVPSRTVFFTKALANTSSNSDTDDRGRDNAYTWESNNNTLARLYRLHHRSISGLHR